MKPIFILLIIWGTCNFLFILLIIIKYINATMKTYYIQYWDKYQNNKSCFIHAKTIEAAEQKFYKKNPYTLIKKISLN